tara:strand:- start:460 stop:630 length:171 start_codon:yes stop_codon:yes gene_type:complete
MIDAKIHSKRGVWYVTEPGHPLKTFESEAEAIAYVGGHTEPDDLDSILDEDWDDEE